MKWVIFMMFLAGCAAGPNPVLHSECSNPAGFFLGYWHGCIFPLSFLVSLFTDDVSVYAVCNTGGWYNFGFYLGIGGVSSGASSAASSKRKTSSKRKSSP